MLFVAQSSLPSPRTHDLISLLDKHTLIRAFAACVVLTLLLLSAHVAYATTIFVDSDCSLSEAIKSANDDATPAGSSCEAGSGADKIRLKSNLTITRAPTSVTSDITIEGRGKDISGNNNIRPFNVTDGHLKLEYLDIKDTKVRNDNGGAIKVTGSASLTLTRVDIENSHAEIIAIQNTGNGGAIYFDSSGTLTIEDRSNITESSAQVDGGAVYLKKGTLDIEDTNLNKNKAQGDGGAVYLAGGSTVTFEDVSTKLNIADDSGGAFFIAGGSTVTFDDVSVSKNEAKGSGYYLGGGGIAIDIAMTGKTVTITDSDFSENKAANGGAILNGDPYRNPTEGASLVVIRTAFRENTATGDGAGAIHSEAEGLTVDRSVFKKNKGRNGGAIFSGREDLTVTKSSFTENTVPGNGGAIWHGWGNKQLTIEDSTFGANAAQSGYAILHVDGTMTLKQVTVANNKQVGSIGGYAAVAVSKSTQGGTTPNVTIRNSILADNGNDCNLQQASVLTRTVTYSIIESGISCSSSTTKTHDPMLGSLTNGYYPLKAGSPAIDAGGNSQCTASDQTGLQRPQRGDCDVGAYEYPGLVYGETWADKRLKSERIPFGFEAKANDRVTALVESNASNSTGEIVLDIIDSAGDIVKSATAELSQRTTALIYNWKAPYTGRYKARVTTQNKTTKASMVLPYEVTLGKGNLDTIKERNGFKVEWGRCGFGGSSNSLWHFNYKPQLFRTATDISLKTAKVGADSPKFNIIFSTLEKAQASENAHFKQYAEELGHAGIAIGSKALAHGAFHVTKNAIGLAKLGLSTKAAVLTAAATTSATPIVMTAVVTTVAYKAYNRIMYDAMVDITTNNYDVNTFSDHDFELKSWLDGITLPDAYSKGFLMGVHTFDLGSNGAIVLVVADNVVGTALQLNDVSSQVRKTVLCPGNSLGGVDSETTTVVKKSAPAEPKPQKSTGQQINEDPNDGVDVTAQFGVNSGIQFQRRDKGTVNTVKADNIGAVVSAGVKDVIDVWGYANQQAQTCFDNDFVGVNGGIMFIEKTGLGAQVHTTPPTTNNGSQTCIATNTAGLVVLVANAPASASPTMIEAPAPDEEPVPAGCMVTTTAILNFRQSPSIDGAPVLDDSGYAFSSNTTPR